MLIDRRLASQYIMAFASTASLGSGCGDGEIQSRCAAESAMNTCGKTVGMWVLLLWFDDPTQNFFPWQQYTRVQPAFGRYTSSDDRWINHVIDSAEAMAIDYIILDDTNGVFRHDGYFDRAIQCYLEIIRYRNSKIRVVIASGYEIFEKKDWTLFNQSIEHLRNFFESSAYYNLDGKPMLLLYINPGDSVSRLTANLGIIDKSLANLSDATDEYGFKKYLKDLSVRYVSGSENWINDVDGVYGWKFEYPQRRNKNSMGVMPGWDRSHNTLTGSSPVLRGNGEYYRKSWERILEVNPRNVIITSWDDWAEETAIAAGLEWGSLYVDMSKKYIEIFKSLPVSP